MFPGRGCVQTIAFSGEKIIGKGRLRTNNRANVALKMAAGTLRLSNTHLGAQFRRLRTKLGAPIAIKAMAAKLARGPRSGLLRGSTQTVTDQAAAKLGYMVTLLPAA